MYTAKENVLKNKRSFNGLHNICKIKHKLSMCTGITHFLLEKNSKF